MNLSTSKGLAGKAHASIEIASDDATMEEAIRKLIECWKREVSREEKQSLNDKSPLTFLYLWQKHFETCKGKWDGIIFMVVS